MQKEIPAQSIEEIREMLRKKALPASDNVSNTAPLFLWAGYTDPPAPIQDRTSFVPDRSPLAEDAGAWNAKAKHAQTREDRNRSGCTILARFALVNFIEGSP